MAPYKWKNRKARPLPSTMRKLPQSHPSRSGSRGYSMDTREAALASKQAGFDDSPQNNILRNQRKYPSKRSVQRWEARFGVLGHTKPFQQNGNKRATVLRGRTRLLMAQYRIAFPKCTQAEMNCFLYNTTPPGEEKRFYCSSQISRAEDDLGLSRKRGATTARQANLPHNLNKKDQYLTQQFPYGAVGLNPHFTIDWDEAAIFLETTDRGHGKCYIGKDCKEAGPYGHSEKYTLTMAICGNPAGDRWVDCEVKSGTTVSDTVTFLERIMGDLPQGQQYTFLCDNLSSHKNPLVQGTIYMGGHRLLFRPPYCPWLGPIEYVFNTLQHELTLRMHEVSDAVSLQVAVRDIVNKMGSFQNYFAHCLP